MELMRGDNDKENIWKGKKQSVVPDYKVSDLQTDLNRIGIYTHKIDGVFNVETERSLKLFQWVIKNSKKAVKGKASLSVTPVPSIKVHGKLDDITKTKVRKWVAEGFVATGDLVRVSCSELTNVEIGPGFKHIGSPVVKKGDIVVSRDIVSLIKLMNEVAKSLKITIKINQAFRINGVKVTGSVVPPATKSQHLIGHAVDCNIVDGKSWNSSADFKNKKQTKNAKKFISKIKNGSFRWGGDFVRVDTPHFDKRLNPSSFDYVAKFFLNQKQLSRREPVEKALLY